MKELAMKNNKKNSIENRTGNRFRFLFFVVIACLFVLIGAMAPTTSRAQYAEPSSAPPRYSGSGHCVFQQTIFCEVTSDCTVGNPADFCDTAEIHFPLNASSVTQRKLGSLLIGDRTTNSSLCLNASTSGVFDSTNCITDWSQAVAVPRPGQKLLKLSTLGQAGPSTCGPGQVGDNVCDYAQQDIGYIRVKGDVTKNQKYSLYLDADPTGLGGRTALYASDTSSVGTNYAGYFSGKFLVDNTGASPDTAELCLNNTTPWNPSTLSGGCIKKWTDILFSSPAINYVKLQTGPTYSADGGLSQVKGIGFFGSGSAGVPPSGSLPPSGVPYSCGDGICSPPGETQVNCPIDCGLINVPSITAVPQNVPPSTVRVTINIPPPGTAPTGNVWIVLVRGTGAAPTFVPQQGVTYAPNQPVGNDFIVFAGTRSQPSNNPFNDINLTNGTTYYYAAYQGHPGYPRYGSPATASATPDQFFHLTVINTTLKDSHIIGPGGINCGINQSGVCGADFINGTAVTLNLLTLQAGERWNGFSGDCAGYVCNVVMDSDKLVQANFSLNGGGGPPPGPPPPRGE